MVLFIPSPQVYMDLSGNGCKVPFNMMALASSGWLFQTPVGFINVLSNATTSSMECIHLIVALLPDAFKA